MKTILKLKRAKIPVQSSSDGSDEPAEKTKEKIKSLKKQRSDVISMRSTVTPKRKRNDASYISE